MGGKRTTLSRRDHYLIAGLLTSGAIFAAMMGIFVPRQFTAANDVLTPTTLTSTVTTTTAITSTITTTASAQTITNTVTTTIRDVSTTTVTTTLTTAAATRTVTTISTTSQKSGLILRNVTSGIIDKGYYVVSGEAFNNGTTIANYVNVYAVFYDSRRYIITSYQTITSPQDISPGQTAGFTIIITDTIKAANIASYKIVVFS